MWKTINVSLNATDKDAMSMVLLALTIYSLRALAGMGIHVYVLQGRYI